MSESFKEFALSDPGWSAVIWFHPGGYELTFAKYPPREEGEDGPLLTIDDRLALARALLPDGAAIVADPAGLITLIMQYALVFGDQDIDAEILALIKSALGFEGEPDLLKTVEAQPGVFVTDPAGLWTLIERWYTVALQGHGKRATVESIALHGEIRQQIRAALGMEEQ